MQRFHLLNEAMHLLLLVQHGTYSNTAVQDDIKNLHMILKRAVIIPRFKVNRENQHTVDNWNTTCFPSQPWRHTLPPFRWILGLGDTKWTGGSQASSLLLGHFPLYFSSISTTKLANWWLAHTLPMGTVNPFQPMNSDSRLRARANHHIFIFIMWLVIENKQRETAHLPEWI